MLSSGFRILLLQGPVGPFFDVLRRHLILTGNSCHRVCFNAGDRLFASTDGRTDFEGGPEAWRTWLKTYVSKGVDLIIAFGCCRPPHRIAREIATEAQIPILFLEEGYIRGGYITAEFGGNNALSPLAGHLPPPDFDERGGPPSVALPGSFVEMCWHGAKYYIARTLFSRTSEAKLFHRPLRALPEVYYWARNLLRYKRFRTKDYVTIERLLEHADKRYYLVPLQVATDAQMGEAALGWTPRSMALKILAAFANTAPAGTQLVFKVHPLDRGHGSLGRTINDTAREMGVGARVHVLMTGSLGLLTRHAAGMITINSTSGLSAVFHGTPLMVLGKAVYSNPVLATCASEKPDFASFWQGGTIADPITRRRYLAWLRAEALVPGDFYSSHGMQVASQSLSERLLQLESVAMRSMANSPLRPSTSSSVACADLRARGLVS